MPDRLRAGRVKKLLSDLRPPAAPEKEPADAEAEEPEVQSAEIRMRRKKKKKKFDDDPADMPANTNSTY